MGSTSVPTIPDEPEEEEDLEAFLEQNVWDEENQYDDWNRLTECEKSFFSSNPHALIPARSNKSSAEKYAAQFFPSCDQHNDIADAFRHSFFSALNYKSIGTSNAKELGDAHECDVPLNELPEKEMDLNNNNWGFTYASLNRNFTAEDFYVAFMASHNLQPGEKSLYGNLIVIESCH